MKNRPIRLPDRMDSQSSLFAETNQVSPLIAAKTLSAVEVDRSISNQHEFHAGLLRKHLGFGTERIEGGCLSILFHLAEDVEPFLDETTFTLYDARENVSTRHPEWHLYYSSESRIQALAREGDLLVIYRPDRSSNNLSAIIARPGTRFESDLRQALDIGGDDVIKHFIRPEPQLPAGEEAAHLALALIEPRGDGTLEISQHPTYQTAVASGEIPSTREMAAAAHDLVSSAGSDLDADEYFERALAAESELFFAMESAIGERQLAAMLEKGLDFSAVLAFAMSKHQARRSRRGQSLQNHLEFLLKEYGIPHRAQCPTEDGETPDFIIPSREAYADPAYPEAKLRMIGCKSKLRDRWRQYLNEAKRVNPKFHVSLDEELSDDLLVRMDEHGLRLFMPREIIERGYAGRTSRERIGTIRDLIEDLKTL